MVCCWVVVFHDPSKRRVTLHTSGWDPTNSDRGGVEWDDAVFVVFDVEMCVDAFHLKRKSRKAWEVEQYDDDGVCLGNQKLRGE